MAPERRVVFDPGLVPDSPDLSFESALWSAGVPRVAGVDEAGRGALAGPVAAAAVIFPDDAGLQQVLYGVRDSKQLAPGQRTFWATSIRSSASAWAIGYASAQEIDTLGIVPATRLAVQRALDALCLPPGHLLLDYLLLSESALPQTSLIKGDRRSLSVAAASILAKTARDALLEELECQFPGYGLAMHKGYGTSRHLAALERLGPSPIHRWTFKPVLESRLSLVEKLSQSCSQ